MKNVAKPDFVVVVVVVVECFFLTLSWYWSVSEIASVAGTVQSTFSVVAASWSISLTRSGHG